MLLSANLFSQLTSAVYSYYSGESIMLPHRSFVTNQSQIRHLKLFEGDTTIRVPLVLQKYSRVPAPILHELVIVQSQFPLRLPLINHNIPRELNNNPWNVDVWCGRLLHKQPLPRLHQSHDMKPQLQYVSKSNVLTLQF